MRTLFVFSIIALGVLLPVFSLAQINLNLDYPTFAGIDLNTNQNLNTVVAWLYYFIVGIAGLAAFVMIVWGGIQWLTSGAIPSQASEARDKLRAAILGLLLILASFLIIQVINPQLTLLNQPGLTQFFGTVPSLNLPQAPGGPPGSVGSGSVTLTADGQHPLLCTNSPTVQLNWSVTGVTNCQADSSPDPLWTGPKPDTGPESVTILSQGLNRFTLSCAALAEHVEVNFTTGSCAAGAPITVDLTGRDQGVSSGTGGPFACPGDFPSGTMVVEWTASPGTTCSTTGGAFGTFAGAGLPPTGSRNEQICNALPGDYPYSITCTDGSQTATDSFIVTVP